MDFSDSSALANLMRRNSKSKRNTDEQDGELERWEKEKKVFELQLNQIQEQLVEAMVKNQELTDENKTLQKYDSNKLTKLLDEEKTKRKSAEETLRRIILAKKRRGSTSSSVSMENDEYSYDVNGISSPDHPDAEALKRIQWKKKLLDYKITAWNFLHERISDFVNDEDKPVEDVEEQALSIRCLKENVARFSDAIQPFKRCYQFLSGLFSWKNPWLTITIFLIFMYAVWLDVYVPMTFMLMIMQLFVNYLHARGIAQRFTHKKISKHSLEKEDAKETEASASLSERYQLVLSIARTVQNTLGVVTDNLEKLQNLLLWQHHEASKMLFSGLLLVFFASCILSTSTFLICVGLVLGIKLFIVTPVYTRFPKVQRRYDDVQRLWEDLPTHAQNLQRKVDDLNESNEETRISQSQRSNSPNSSTSSNDFTTVGHEESAREDTESWSAIIFCDRFQLPRSETPLHDWREGRRCTLMDKDSPLSSMKHGRLYLTANYICFERNQFHNKKNIAIKLTDVVTVKKSKPISFMPGPGMAIEVTVSNMSKPYIFAAMMGRDEAFDSVIRAGRLLSVAWARSS